jgi:hypothetical protein
MSAWQPKAGEALLMPSGAGDHLFVILNDPTPFTGYGSKPHVVLVNLSTVHEGIPYDATCVLEPGCHPFVKRRSFAYFGRARVEPSDHVQTLVSQGYFKPLPAMPAGELERMLAGLRISPFTKRAVKLLGL